MKIIEIYSPAGYRDLRPFSRKAFDLIISLSKYFFTFFEVLFYRSFGAYHLWESLQVPQNSRGLFVFLHGLNGNPAQWHRQIDILRTRHPNITLFVPLIYKKGNCSLEEAAEPILHQIQNYIDRHPTKPICLCGTSNGGRIALHLETKLRERGRTAPVRVSSIAGVILGTIQMNRFMKLRIAQKICPKIICKELRYGSPRVQQLLQKANFSLADTWEREFYATPEDIIVRNIGSSLPPMLKGKKFVIEGESHGSIVSAVAHRQIQNSLSWLNRVAA